MIEKSVLEKLYFQDQLSMMDIAKQLTVSPHKVVWWMDRHGLKRRTWTEATYLKRNPDGDPFNIKKNLSPDELFLLGLGLGLYWGEGNKANNVALRLGNTDPRLIKAFVKFLQEICGVPRDKIKFSLMVFNDINPDSAIEYWQNTLGFPRSSFAPKICAIPPQDKGTYKKKSQYGVVTVAVCNKKLRNWVIQNLIKIADNA